MSPKWRNALLITACVVCVLGAGGALAWYLRPEPPPTTAEEVYDALMDTDPTKLSDEEVARWIERVASTVERLSPEESERLATKALGDKRLRKRFESLTEEQRQRIVSLVSDEQKSRMAARMVPKMVELFKAMPAFVRTRALRRMHERSRRQGRRGQRKMSKERFARFHAASTPRDRAEMVRAFREMRRMLEEAGIRD